MSSKVRKRTQVDVDKDRDEQKKKNAYAWESTKIRSWEQIEEDPETGRLKSFEREEQIARRHIRDDGLAGVRRGIIRFCVVIIDMSAPLRATDLKPSRGELIAETLRAFAEEFFDQNPISQLCLIVTRDGEAGKMTSFTSTSKPIAEAVQKIIRLGPAGTASLQNALNLAQRMLSSVPPYGLREVLVCFGSLSSCDPGDIFQTIDRVAKTKIRCSVVGLGAEVHILRVLAKRTEGTYTTAMHEEHFRELMNSHVTPPPLTSRQTSVSLIRMGFPFRKRRNEACLYVNDPIMKGKFGYECPRCSSWLSEIPCECPLCGLSLVSSPHLGRSYHHLFPVKKYISFEQPSPMDGKQTEEPDETTKAKAEEYRNADMLRCRGCKVLLAKSKVLRLICPSCQSVLCSDCDIFVHDSLHQCPGCEDTV